MMSRRAQPDPPSSPSDVGTELSLERIVNVAILIADTEGLDALSMRRVANELGAGAMSLYRHVANKEALLTEMTRTVTERYPYPVPAPAHWRDALRTAARLDFESYRRHPWLLLTVNSPRYLTDSVCFDWVLAALRGLTHDPALARVLALSLWSYTMGSSVTLLSALLLPTPAAGAMAALSAEDFEIGLDVVLDGMAARSERA